MHFIFTYSCYAARMQGSGDWKVSIHATSHAGIDKRVNAGIDTQQEEDGENIFGVKI
jgi:hypothetical protein